jgi:transcriptional regulator with XRE-family HTH domain
MRQVATNVKRIRQEKGFTQQALADRIGIQRVYVAKIEGGVKTPSLQMLARLAKALKVLVGELVE